MPVLSRTFNIEDVSITSEKFLLQVLVPKDPGFIGKMVEVDIYEAGKHFMKGQPVSDAKVYTPSLTKPFAKGEVSGVTEVSKDVFCFTTLVKQQLFQHNDSRICICYRL